MLTAPRVPADVESGDVVGILASYAKADGSPGKTSMDLSRVLVVGVKDDVTGGTGEAVGTTGKRVTLAVTTQQAEKIANIAEFGKIWLTAQPSTDEKAKTTEAKDVS